MTKTIDDVRAFWELHPLWEGESLHETGSADFFAEHRRAVVDDCFAGSLDERIFPTGPRRARVLDLGCGVGFWTIELARRGCHEITAADLTARAVELTRRRCELLGVDAVVLQENAEHLTFADGSFTHVNCQGVIHHTPHPAAAVAEIARVLEPGGTASISVYYRNALLRAWPVLRPLASLLAREGARLRGRGRESIYRIGSADEIVRTFDGAENPIGIAFSRGELRRLLEPHFDVEQLFVHFFPARTLPLAVPRSVHRILDRALGFMVYASVRKPELTA